MSEPSLSAAQQRNFERIVETLRKRQDLPPATLEFLLALRRHLLASGVLQATLARRAAELEGPPPAGRANVGHNLAGAFNKQRLGDELAGRDRLPREALVAAVAEFFCKDMSDDDTAEVLAGLQRLRVTAEEASAKHRTEHEQAALADGRRVGSGEELRGMLRLEQDRRAEAEGRERDVSDRLATLQERYNELAALQPRMAQSIATSAEENSRLRQETSNLRGEVKKLTGEVTEARTYGLSLRAEADQLLARIDELERQQGRPRGVRQDPPDSSGPGPKTVGTLVSGYQDSTVRALLARRTQSGSPSFLKRLSTASEGPRDLRVQLGVAMSKQGLLKGPSNNALSSDGDWSDDGITWSPEAYLVVPVVVALISTTFAPLAFALTGVTSGYDAAWTSWLVPSLLVVCLWSSTALRRARRNVHPAVLFAVSSAWLVFSAPQLSKWGGGDVALASLLWCVLSIGAVVTWGRRKQELYLEEVRARRNSVRVSDALYDEVNKLKRAAPGPGERGERERAAVGPV